MMYQKLRTIGIIPLIASVMLSSCEKPANLGPESNQSGEVVISLSQDSRIHNLQTKAGEDEAPALDGFRVEIFNSKSVRLYNQKYDVAKDAVIKLNTGSYRMLAYHGDSLGCGFAKPYYLADKSFDVISASQNSGQPQKISAVAKLANVKLAVQYGENLKEYYPEYYAVIKHEEIKGKKVLFSQNETRAAYIPGGKIYAEIYARMPEGDANAGELRYYKTGATEYSPNDFVTFKFDVSTVNGNISVQILVDDSAELISQEFEIDYEDLPGNKPFFKLGGQTRESYNIQSYMGYAKPESAELSIRADGKLKTALVEVDVPHINQNKALVKTELDLTNLSSADAQALANAGITYSIDPESKFGLISFSKMVDIISMENTQAGECGTVKVTAVDKYDRGVSTTLVINTTPIPLSVSLNDYDIWGAKIAAASAAVNSSEEIINPDLRLQYRKEGVSGWMELKPESVSGKTAKFGSISGLSGNTRYQLRAVLGDKALSPSDVVTVTTEAFAQLGNNGFEEYQEQTYQSTISAGFGNKVDVKWWKLFAAGSTQWWASNATRTIVSRVTAAYPDYKTYPTTALFTNGAYSGKSIMVATVAVGNGASKIAAGTPYTGELYLGTSNDKVESEWGKSSEGHNFSSRPSALEFMYKFDRHKNPFVAEIKILDANGTEIGSGVYNSAATSVSSWTKMTIPITYSVTNKKAASIRVSFKSEPSTNGTRRIDVNTLSGGHEIYAGSVLYLDDIKLTY